MVDVNKRKDILQQK